MPEKKRDNDDEEAQRPFLDGSSEDVSLDKPSPLPLAPMSLTDTTTKKRRRWMAPLRVVVELAMAGVIVFLLLRNGGGVGGGGGGEGGEKRSPVPSFPKKSVTFMPDHQYLYDGMFANETATLATLHNWIPLSADGRGYVIIDDAEKYDLKPPYVMKINDTYSQDVYMLSVFHQLHCLSYLAQAFQTAFTPNPPTNEVAFHSVHCFDYIRQAILCNADTSLEGETGEPGWGSEHQCKDIDGIREWANQRDVFKYRGNMPDDSTL